MKITIERETLERAIAALDAANGFISNGVGLGYIRMPDADCPDPAHLTPGKVQSARVALHAALAAQPAEPVAQVVPFGATVKLEWASTAAAHNCKPGPLYAAPPAPAAVPLTDEKIDHTLATTLDEFARTTRGMSHALDVNADITANSRLRRMFARAVLAAAGDKP